MMLPAFIIISAILFVVISVGCACCFDSTSMGTNERNFVLICTLLFCITTNITNTLYNEVLIVRHSAGQYVSENGYCVFKWNDELEKMKAEKEKKNEQ